MHLDNYTFIHLDTLAIDLLLALIPSPSVFRHHLRCLSNIIMLPL